MYRRHEPTTRPEIIIINRKSKHASFLHRLLDGIKSQPRVRIEERKRRREEGQDAGIAHQALPLGRRRGRRLRRKVSNSNNGKCANRRTTMPNQLARLELPTAGCCSAADRRREIEIRGITMRTTRLLALLCYY